MLVSVLTSVFSKKSEITNINSIVMARDIIAYEVFEWTDQGIQCLYPQLVTTCYLFEQSLVSRRNSSIFLTMVVSTEN